MTLKELFLKYEFDTVVPDLLTVDEPIKDNLYAFKEAFDTLLRMAQGDAQGEQIVVNLEVETEEEGTEIERYLYASNCEGDLWDSSLAKEVVNLELDLRQFLQRVEKCQILLPQLLEELVQGLSIAFVEHVDPF